MTDFVKIIFPLEVDEDGYPPISSEALNARREPAGFVLENTPFFATGVALGDCVDATPVQGVPDKFTFARVVKSSTTKAISVLEYLMLHPDEVLSRERLLDAVWGWDYPAATRAVDTRIAELRRALRDDAETPQFIKTWIGQGYCFIGRVEAKA